MNLLITACSNPDGTHMIQKLAAVLETNTERVNSLCRVRLRGQASPRRRWRRCWWETCYRPMWDRPQHGRPHSLQVPICFFNGTVSIVRFSGIKLLPMLNCKGWDRKQSCVDRWLSEHCGVRFVVKVSYWSSFHYCVMLGTIFLWKCKVTFCNSSLLTFILCNYEICHVLDVMELLLFIFSVSRWHWTTSNVFLKYRHKMAACTECVLKGSEIVFVDTAPKSNVN